ncbi:MAG: thiol peroxidase [Nitrospirae bacterium]|nr:MAG: thiol peroxidase [Nitrospirota bacterium]
MRSSIHIILLSCLLGYHMFLAGCGFVETSTADSGFTYRDIPVAKTSIGAGEGSYVIFKGKRLPLSGPGIHVGESLRPALVTRLDLTTLDITHTQGSVRIISIVPSLDTRVCEQQTHYLSENNRGLDQHVSLVTISVDTPFAQARFAREAGIDNVTFYSDYRGGAFGKAHGLFLEDLHVLTRAILVVDRDNTIRHLQITPELGQLPDMDAAFSVARTLLGASPHP